MFDESKMGLNEVFEPLDPLAESEAEEAVLEPVEEPEIPADAPAEAPGDAPEAPEAGGEPLTAAEVSLYALLGKDVVVEPGLNRNAGATVENGYSPGQCARLSSGTQNYCPFAGSGR